MLRKNKFDLARYLEDSFWMLAILAQCVFERLRAAREQATKDTILFADDPIAKTILANKDGRAGGASGRIFDKLHDYMFRSCSLIVWKSPRRFMKSVRRRARADQSPTCLGAPRPSLFSAGIDELERPA